MKRVFEKMSEVTDQLLVSHHKKKPIAGRLDGEEVADWLRRLGVCEDTLLVVLGFSRT